MPDPVSDDAANKLDWEPPRRRAGVRFQMPPEPTAFWHNISQRLDMLLQTLLVKQLECTGEFGKELAMHTYVFEYDVAPKGQIGWQPPQTPLGEVFQKLNEQLHLLLEEAHIPESQRYSVYRLYVSLEAAYCNSCWVLCEGRWKIVPCNICC